MGVMGSTATPLPSRVNDQTGRLKAITMEINLALRFMLRLWRFVRPSAPAGKQRRWPKRRHISGTLKQATKS